MNASKKVAVHLGKDYEQNSLRFGFFLHYAEIDL